MRESRVGERVGSGPSNRGGDGAWFAVAPVRAGTSIPRDERLKKALERYISLSSLPLASSPTTPLSSSSSSKTNPTRATKLKPKSSPRAIAELARMRRTARGLGLKVVEGQLAAEVEVGSGLEKKESPMEGRDARELLVALTSSERGEAWVAFGEETEGLDRTARLQLVWDAYLSPSDARATPDLVHSVADFQLALTFLHHLVSSATEEEQGPLTLALVVLRTLIEGGAMAEEDVAAPPPPPPSSCATKTVMLRTILLRTVVPLALGDGNFELACRALKELVELRAGWATVEVEEGEGEGDDEVERMLVVQTAEQMIESIRRQRGKTYRRLDSPSPSPDSDSDSDSDLLAVHHLLTVLLPQLSPAAQLNDQGSPHLDAHTTTLLASFAKEAVGARRWDALSSLWLAWRARGIRLEAPHAVGLAKFYSGLLVLGGVERGGRGLIRVREWELLVEEVRVGLWSEREKVEWVEMLVRGLLASVRSARSARGVYEQIARKGGGGGGTLPLPLPPATVLAFARQSLKDGGAEGGRAFAHRLALDYVRRLTAPSSAYATARIPHYDLTSLAALYSLLGDQASVAQVFSRMLQAKILPDARDVQLILETSWEVEGESLEPQQEAEVVDTRLAVTLGFLSWAAGVGVRLEKGTFEGLLRRMLKGASGGEEGGRRKERVKRVLKVAKRVGLGKGERAGLQSLARLLVREPRESLAEWKEEEEDEARLPTAEQMDDDLLSKTSGRFLPHLFYAQLSGHFSSWRHVLTLHRHALHAYGFQDDLSLALVLRSLLGAYDAKPPGIARTNREALRRGLREVVEEVVRPQVLAVGGGAGRFAEERVDPPLCPVTTKRTADLVVRACFKLEEVQGLDRVLARLEEEEGAGIGERMRVMVRRWRMAREGNVVG